MVLWGYQGPKATAHLWSAKGVQRLEHAAHGVGVATNLHGKHLCEHPVLQQGSQ